MSKRVLTIYEEHIAPARYRGKKRRVYGDTEGSVIRIDPNQDEEEYLDTLVHELCHFLDPDASEDEVIERAAVLSVTLWKYGYRRVRL